MRVSSGIDAASLTDSSLGSEILETLPSSVDGLGYNLLQNHPQPSGGVLLRQATMEMEVIESLTTEIRIEASTKSDPDSALERGINQIIK